MERKKKKCKTCAALSVQPVERDDSGCDDGRVDQKGCRDTCIHAEMRAHACARGLAHSDEAPARSRHGSLGLAHQLRCPSNRSLNDSVQYTHALHCANATALMRKTNAQEPLPRRTDPDCVKGRGGVHQPGSGHRPVCWACARPGNGQQARSAAAAAQHPGRCACPRKTRCRGPVSQGAQQGVDGTDAKDPLGHGLGFTVPLLQLDHCTRAPAVRQTIMRLTGEGGRQLCLDEGHTHTHTHTHTQARERGRESASSRNARLWAAAWVQTLCGERRRAVSSPSGVAPSASVRERRAAFFWEFSRFRTTASTFLSCSRSSS